VKLTLIPSTVGAAGPLQYLSSCLVNDAIALDAGCLGFHATPQEQARVRDIFLSHTHMDHLASLPAFLENAYGGPGDSVTVHASAVTLDSLQRDLFNGRVWPDFVALAPGGRPFVRLAPFEAGQTLERAGVRVTAVALNHVVPTVGYLLADEGGSVAFVSDTGPTEEVWRLANGRPDLRAVFVEAAFPNRHQARADASGHLTPATLAGELAKLRRPARLVVIHIKPRYRAEVVQELRALNVPGLEVGEPGATYEF
jgi:ribonuclease BN (tRNA processing enzyme)